jgi:phosphoribosyl-AMP cyclohydrolase
LKASKLDEIDFAKGNGLVPVVTQEAKTGKVLMLAYANREAVEATMKTKLATYWSRSRNELWKKGDTSGHIQKVRRVLVDCDNDTLLYVVDQTGPACHTGKHSCFFSKLE